MREEIRLYSGLCPSPPTPQGLLVLDEEKESEAANYINKPSDFRLQNYLQQIHDPRESGGAAQSGQTAVRNFVQKAWK